jgi:hypothetical protein
MSSFEEDVRIINLLSLYEINGERSGCLGYAYGAVLEMCALGDYFSWLIDESSGFANFKICFVFEMISINLSHTIRIMPDT